MTWFTLLDVSYHQQDTSYYCGAAAAQMVLDSIGAGLLDQNDLYASNHAHSSPGWYTSPDGLDFTLNALKPAAFTNFFVVDRGNTEHDGSHIIISTLRFFSVAPVALVYGTGHWVVVRGAKTSADPAASGGTYTILGFYINNPWPPTPGGLNSSLAPPPPHSNPDSCGTGGAHGIADEWISYTDWQNNYFTGGDAFGIGHQQWIAVCDPSKPAPARLISEKVKHLRDGKKIISAEEAVKFAKHAIEKHELLNQECAMSTAVRMTRPTQAHLVQRLDRNNEFYYLIESERDGKATSLLRADALYGDFQGALALSKEQHLPIISADTAIAAVKKSPLDLGHGKGRINLHDGGFSVYPNLVWRPCMESRSPYYPFRQVHIGSHTVYVGFDGTVHPALHDLGKG